MATIDPPPPPPSKRGKLLTRKLSAMSYSLPNSLVLTDAVCTLVEKLFTDLVSTTEAYEGLQNKEEATSHELSKAQAQVFPLRKENTRLLRENNQLHLELIKSEDDTGKLKQSHELKTQQLDSEINEAKFLSEQKDHALNKARAEADHLKLQLKAMLGGGGGVPGLKTSDSSNPSDENNDSSNSRNHSDPNSTPAHINGVDMNSNLPPSPTRRNQRSPGNDKRIVAALEAQLGEMKSRMEFSEAEVTRLKQACGAREREVERLGALLEGGRDYDKLNEEHAATAQARMLDQLNRQVDFLNNQLAEREGQVSTLQQQIKNTERMRIEAKQQLSASTYLQEANVKLTKNCNDLNEKIIAMQESNKDLKKNMEKARKAAAHARSDSGVRDSGGSLPGSVGGVSRVNSPMHQSMARSPRNLNVQIASPAPFNAPPAPNAPPNTPTSSAPNLELLAQMNKLQRTVTELQISLSSAEHEANHLNSDNDRLAEALERARRETSDVMAIAPRGTEGLEDMRRQVERSQEERDEARQAVVEADKQSTDLREVAGRMTEEISSMQRMITALTQDKEGGNSIVDRLKGQIGSLNDMLSNKDGDISNLTNAIREAHTEVHELRRALEKQQSELIDLRNKHGEQRNVSEMTKFEADRAKTEAGETQLQLNSAQRNAESERSAREQLELDVRDARTKEKLVVSRCAALESRMEECEELLGRREQEVNTLKNRLSQYEEMGVERIGVERDEVRKQWKDAKERADEAGNELEVVKREKTRLGMALRRAEDDLKSVRMDADEGQGEVGKARAEITSLKDTCDFLEQGKARAEAEREHLRALLNEESASIGVRSEGIDRLERERERLVGRIAELESSLDSERRRRGDTEHRASVGVEDVGRLGIEMKKLKDAKGALEQRLSRVQNELGEARGVVAQLQGDVAGARAELSRERAARSNAEVRKQQQAGVASEVMDRHDQLKGLFGQLERTRDGLVRKLELRTGEVGASNEVASKERERSKVLTAKCVGLEQDKEVLRRNLESLDSEKDLVEARLDEMSEVMRTVKGEREDGERRENEAESMVEDIKERCSRSEGLLNMREQEIARTDGIVRVLKSDCDELRRVLRERERELERAGADLTSVTREAQAISVEGGRLAGELQKTRQKLDEAEGERGKLEHRAKGLELEKGDLMTAYRAVIDERGVLEGGVEKLAGERQGIGQDLASTKLELERSVSVVEELESELRRKAADLGAFERQLDGISRSNLSIQRSLEAAESENRRLKTDLYSARQGAGGMARHTEGLQRQAAEKGEEAGSLREIVRALEGERDGLQRLLSEERTHGHGVETMLSGMRARGAASEEQIRKLARENAGLQTKVNELKIQMGHEQDVLARRAGGEGEGGGGEVDVSTEEALGFESEGEEEEEEGEIKS